MIKIWYKFAIQINEGSHVYFSNLITIFKSLFASILNNTVYNDRTYHYDVIPVTPMPVPPPDKIYCFAYTLVLLIMKPVAEDPHTMVRYYIIYDCNVFSDSNTANTSWAP